MAEQSFPPDAVAIVTGGSGSIGSVIVAALARAGCRVAIFDSVGGDGATGDMPPERICYERVDVCDLAQVTSAVERVVATFGQIDILIHCAGILGPTGFVENCPWDELARVLAIHLNGGVLCSRAVLPYMKSRGCGGSLVFIASIVAETGSAPAPVYSAAKAGLIGFARSLAKQTGRFQIRVNCVSPGSVRGTALAQRSGARPPTSVETAAMLARIPLARMARTQDVADAVLFLCSQQASSITGANITVDAGESFRID